MPIKYHVGLESALLERVKLAVSERLEMCQKETEKAKAHGWHGVAEYWTYEAHLASAALVAMGA
ncbi:MAG: hypothetical protein J0I15_13820 [Herbaspirillum huttiense]|uniref:hypothetical protein n=1 Tax=Herbaspirillum huttiense TaxID=863372 RepID=UPI001ACDB00D|nr:hypothetical protein [Herbaspirillum huttiense]MBN9357526.1 hypothetical protein [Herbaspirillum huttiense]